MITRNLQAPLLHALDHGPAVVLLGPRQAGKTTLALAVAQNRPSLYLDLEDEEDRAKVEAPRYLDGHADKLVILDEVQRLPELFQRLRGIIDRGIREGRGHGRFLLLGSASLDLLKQSGESLAGRVSYLELGPFNALEPPAESLERLWVRGGFPPSFLAEDDSLSLEWRRSFVRSYLERDIPQLGPRIPAETLRRFWTMLAHLQGQPLNAANLARSLEVDAKTVAAYLDLLVDLLLVRRLPAWHRNAGKRLVRAPRIYVRDSGLVHALLGIGDREALLGHPVAGHSWEGLAIETLLAAAPEGGEAHYYRTATGIEVDLVLTLPDGEVWAVEIKRSSAPSPGAYFRRACADVQAKRRFCVYSGLERFRLGEDAEAVGLRELALELARRK